MRTFSSQAWFPPLHPALSSVTLQTAHVATSLPIPRTTPLDFLLPLAHLRIGQGPVEALRGDALGKALECFPPEETSCPGPEAGYSERDRASIAPSLPPPRRLQPRIPRHGGSFPLSANRSHPCRVHAPARISHPPLFRLAVLLRQRIEVLQPRKGEGEEGAELGDLHGRDVGHLRGWVIILGSAHAGDATQGDRFVGTHAEVNGVDRAETLADFGLPRFANVFEQESYPIRRGQVVRGAAGPCVRSVGCLVAGGKWVVEKIRTFRGGLWRLRGNLAAGR